MSISFTAIAFFISQFVSSSISSKGYFLSTKSVFGLIVSFEFNKNHLCQKFIHKNGIFLSKFSFIALSIVPSQPKTTMIFSLKLFINSFNKSLFKKSFKF